MKNFLPGAQCPIRNILSRIGDKWSLLVMIILEANGTMRFNEIQRSLGDISHRMLTITLRTLEKEELVTRRVYAEVPPRIEYRSTEIGKSMLPHVNSLVEWAAAHNQRMSGESAVNDPS